MRSKKHNPAPQLHQRQPVHVVYGGADRYSRDTPQKLGRIAVATMDAYTIDIASVFGIDPTISRRVEEMTRAKLAAEPIEDLRIDFEDGYGTRPDEVEDADCTRAATELAAAFSSGTITPSNGFRVKSFGAATRKRSQRSLDIFLRTFLKATNGELPPGFVVTLPKILDPKEVSSFCKTLEKIEKREGLADGSIAIEVLIEHPLAIFDLKGELAIGKIVDAADGRCVAAHFGAYDHATALGIVPGADLLSHPACDLARQMMLLALVPRGIRCSDSVTTVMPVPVHRGDKLSRQQTRENEQAVIAGLRLHYDNVSRSIANGFYQSWDLHPNQLIARYAAVYNFFLSAMDEQAARLRGFVEKAAQATLSGTTFDDAASAMGIVNFFRQALDRGAIDADEIETATGMSVADIRSGAFDAAAERSR